MDLSDLVKRKEITICLDRYCRGVDRLDRAMIKSAFHQDAIDDHGSWYGTGHDFADWIVDRMSSFSLRGQHHITNRWIELRGDEARVESYFIAYHPRLDEDGNEVLLNAGGRYLDWFEQRDGEWRIAHRQVVNDWSRGALAGTPWAGAALFPAPGPVGDDPSDALFSDAHFRELKRAAPEISQVMFRDRFITQAEVGHRLK